MKPKKTSGGAKTSPARRLKTRPAQPATKTAPKASRKRLPAKRTLAAKKSTPRKPPVKLPAILLEGDHPDEPLVSGPGEKFALGPTPPTQSFESDSAELPASYGTGRLFVTARDPHWLYASWDLTRTQQSRCNARSLDKHLILRIYPDAVRGQPVSEIHVHPESRHWFAHVERADARYAAELGYYQSGRKWLRVAVSAVTLVPPETMSSEAGLEFATIPAEVPLPKLLMLVRQAARESLPLAQAVEALRRSGHPGLPTVTVPKPGPWTPAQTRALAEVIRMDETQRVWIGSLEITGLIRRELQREVSSITAAQFGQPTSPAGAVAGVSSPAGGEAPREKGFWFNVNAELIIYGATERDATVAIGGQKIALRPDGSFSYRFALPDGKYDLPVVAVSADETDARAAELKFTRATELLGDVGAHPQDPALKLPTPDNV